MFRSAEYKPWVAMKSVARLRQTKLERGEGNAVFTAPSTPIRLLVMVCVLFLHALRGFTVLSGFVSLSPGSGVLRTQKL